MKRIGCQFFTGWPDEGITYCDREIGTDGTHEGMHFYHVVHHKEIEEMKTLEERMKAAIKGLENGLVDLKAIVAEAEAEIKAEEARREKGGEKHKGALSEDMKTALKTKGIGHPEIDKNEPLLVKDITIDMVRAKATEYAEIFGMDKLLALNVKFGKSKKLSGIDPSMFGVVFGAMDIDIQAAKKISEAGGTPPTNGELKEKAETLAKEIGAITLADVRVKAAEFISKNGEPALVATLKAFKAEKLSQLPAEKYPAFLEAIGNA